MKEPGRTMGEDVGFVGYLPNTTRTCQHTQEGRDMAEVVVDGDELVLHLTPVEKVLSVHGEPRAPLSAIRSVEVLDNAHEPADRGWRFGERIPGFSEVGVMTTRDERVFAVVHHDTPRGVRINFEGTKYDAWIVGCQEPEALKSSIESSWGV